MISRLLFTTTILLLVWSGIAAQAGSRFDQSAQPDDHLVYSLQLENGAFQGVNEYLPGFTYTITVTPDNALEAMNATAFRAAVEAGDVTGTLTYPTGTETTVAFEIVQHRDQPDIYMKTRMGYFLWEDWRLRPDGVDFIFDYWYTPPATPADLEVVDLARSLLANADNWRRTDDRKCEDDTENGQWSLFCALKHATLDRLQEYNHHGKVLMAVRAAIQELTGKSDYDHTLMDFNNAEPTDHQQILEVLEHARVTISEELAH